MRKACAARLRAAFEAARDTEGVAEASAALSPAEAFLVAHDWEVWAREDQLPPLLFAPSDSASRSLPEGAEHLLRGASSSRPPGADDGASGRLEERESEAPIKRKSPGADDGASGRLEERESEAPIKRVWLILGGRGSGKTRAGAEWVRRIACGEDRNAEPARIALVGKTILDVRNVMVEGVSGLLAIHPDHERPEFEPSKRRLTWKTGAVAELFSADEAEALRGPQFSAAWCDELAKWYRAERAWDMLQFGLRLGASPQAVVTTTPRALVFMKKLIADAATVTTHLSTADNARNLAPAFLAEMTRRYAHSDLGRQELLGEVIDDNAQSLWRRAWIEAARVTSAPELKRVVVALDPPVTATASSDACGIVVAGLGVDGRAYVLADRTIQGREVQAWAKAALAAYDDFAADRLVAEVNQGGDLVVAVLKQFRDDVPISKVRATRGKWVRAEPVSALYAEGRVAHVGRFGELEDQMCAFDAEGLAQGRSPDRVDALVWALTELMLSAEVSPSVRVL